MLLNSGGGGGNGIMVTGIYPCEYCACYIGHCCLIVGIYP